MNKYAFTILLMVTISRVHDVKVTPVADVNWCEVTSLATQAANDNFSKYMIAKNKVEGLDYQKYNLYDVTYLSGQPASLLEKKESPGKFMFYQVLSKDAAEFQSIVTKIEICLLTDTNGKWNKITSTATAATWMNTTLACMVMMYSDKFGVNLTISSYK
jgi:hypothetical protein